MNVMVSALSLAFTVIASSLPAHFKIFDMLEKNKYSHIMSWFWHACSLLIAKRLYQSDCTERKSEMNCTGAELGSVTCGIGCAAED